MQSRLKKFIIILLLTVIIYIVHTHNRLSLYNIKKEVRNVFGRQYIVTISDTKSLNNSYTVSAFTSEELYTDIDYDENLDVFTDRIKSYRPNSKINKITLMMGYDNIGSRYLGRIAEIELAGIMINK